MSSMKYRELQDVINDRCNGRPEVVEAIYASGIMEAPVSNEWKAVQVVLIDRFGLESLREIINAVWDRIEDRESRMIN